MRKMITVEIEGYETEYFGSDLERAIRYWDSISYKEKVVGSIGIREWDSEQRMVRDGNLIHVTADGGIYVSPTLLIA